MIANTVDIRNLAPGYDVNGMEVARNPVPIATNPQYVINKIKITIPKIVLSVC